MASSSLDALGTLWATLLPAQLKSAGRLADALHGYVLIKDTTSEQQVWLELDGAAVRRVSGREREWATLLSMTGTVEGLRSVFAGGAASAIEQGSLRVEGERAFMRAVGASA